MALLDWNGTGHRVGNGFTENGMSSKSKFMSIHDQGYKTFSIYHGEMFVPVTVLPHQGRRHGNHKAGTELSIPRPESLHIKAETTIQSTKPTIYATAARDIPGFDRPGTLAMPGAAANPAHGQARHRAMVIAYCRLQYYHSSSFDPFY